MKRVRGSFIITCNYASKIQSINLLSSTRTFRQSRSRRRSGWRRRHDAHSCGTISVIIIIIIRGERRQTRQRRQICFLHWRREYRSFRSDEQFRSSRERNVVCAHVRHLHRIRVFFRSCDSSSTLSMTRGGNIERRSR